MRIENECGITVLYADKDCIITDKDKKISSSIIYLGVNDNPYNYTEIGLDIWERLKKDNDIDKRQIIHDEAIDIMLNIFFDIISRRLITVDKDVVSMLYDMMIKKGLKKADEIPELINNSQN